MSNVSAGTGIEWFKCGWQVFRENPVPWVFITVVFFLLRAIPGDPASYMLGEYATEESVAALKAELGLDRPAWEQYLRFVGRALTGDLGTSVATGQPAFDEVLESLPWSAALASAGIVIAVVVGVPLGVISAVGKAREKPLVWKSKRSSSTASNHDALVFL